MAQCSDDDDDGDDDDGKSDRLVYVVVHIYSTVYVSRVQLLLPRPTLETEI